MTDISWLQAVHDAVVAFPFGAQIWLALVFIVVISVLVFVHELGHYLAARSVGIRVEVFSIGFGKELFGWNDSHGTRWKVSAVPLGGFVKMFGDESAEGLKGADKKVAFLAKNVWQRMWVVFAGPLANFVFAFVALSALMYNGEQRPVPMEEQSPTLGKVMAGTPADKAGLQRGDLILKVGDADIINWLALVDAVSDRPGEQTRVVFERNKQLMEVMLTPESVMLKLENGEEKNVGRMGVRFSPDTVEIEHGILDSIKLGATKTFEITAKIVDSVKGLITREVPADQVGGPLMIAEVAGDSASEGFYPLVMFMVIISINLGLINLFPIPMLDGGHLVFFAVEAIKGSPVSEKIQDYAFRFGLAVIIMLMGLGMFNDIVRLFEKFAG